MEGMRSDSALTRTISHGQHAYVFSDLDLDTHSQATSTSIHKLVTFLGEIDDPATIIFAGNLFDFGGRPAANEVRATLANLPSFASALRKFTSQPRHHVILLPGAHDAELRDDREAQEILEDMGIEIIDQLELALEATRTTVRVPVVTGHTEALSDSGDHAGVMLDDQLALPRFISSRTLYRRFGLFLWLGVALVAGFDLFNSLTRVVGLFTHHHYGVHAPHTHTVAGNIILNFLVLVGLEAVFVTLVSVAVRRRFRWRRNEDASPFSEPLAQTFIGSTTNDALSYAAALDTDVAGLIVGGATRPALAYLDGRFCASPGPTRTVTTECDATLNLPSIFVEVDRFSMVEIAVGSDVQIRLVGAQSAPYGATVLERLLTRSAVQPGLPETATVIGSWPNGTPFPSNPERLSDARRQRSVRRWASGLLLLNGLINIVVTVSPPLHNRLSHVLKFVPLVAAQSAATVTALAGVAMIMLARGIRRGQRRAWYFAEAALAITVISHVIRAGSLAASVVAAGLFAFLLLTRRDFAAFTDRTSVTGALPRLIGTALIAIVAGALGVEVIARHQSDHLPNFFVVLGACTERLVGIYATALPDGVSDFVNPVLLTVGTTLIVVLLYLVTRPVVDRRLSSTATVAERRLAEHRARDIVRRHGAGTLDYFALRDDKQFFFHRDSLVAYAVYGGVALVSPDPIGPEAERPEVFSAFRTFAESRGWTVAVMAAGADWLPIYHAAGFHSLYLGDEAIVDCQSFSLEGGKMKGLRQACTRLAKYGYTVEFCDPATIDPAEIMGILDLVAMMRRGDDERGFSMMLGRLFDPKDKGLLLVIVRGPDGRPAAACQFVPSPAIHGYSLDLMRRDPGDHPNGLIDYALCSTIAHLREQGATGLSLNFSAFRGVLDGERGEGTWTRVERWTLQRLSGVLPIASLWTFNAKYQPRWLPRHIVYPALESFVPVVAAILRAESLTEFPMLGRFLANDPANRPGTVVPPEVLEAAQRASDER